MTTALPKPPSRRLPPTTTSGSGSERSDCNKSQPLQQHFLKGLLLSTTLTAAVLVLVGIHSSLSIEQRRNNNNTDPHDDHPPPEGATTIDLSKPILLLGLPKSGSEALHAFFQCMGVTSYHYCCDHDDDDDPNHAFHTTEQLQSTPRTSFPCRHQTCGGCIHGNMMKMMQHELSVKHGGVTTRIVDPWLGCGDSSTAAGTTTTSSKRMVVFSQFDVESQDPFGWFLPQRFALPLLEAHSGLWILNQRSHAPDWATHILHWYSITQRLFTAFNLSYYDDASPLAKASVVVAPTRDLSVDDLKQAFDESLARARNRTDHERRHDQLVQVYQQHERLVQLYAKRHHHALLSIAVDGDPAEISVALAKALQLDDLHRARQCWKFDPNEYGADWLDFRLKF
jgi:hypothetical protein